MSDREGERRVWNVALSPLLLVPMNELKLARISA